MSKMSHASAHTFAKNSAFSQKLYTSTKTFPMRAPGQNRTAGTRFRRAVLYPLSYEGASNTLAEALAREKLRNTARQRRAYLSN